MCYVILHLWGDLTIITQLLDNERIERKGESGASEQDPVREIKCQKLILLQVSKLTHFFCLC